MTSLLEKALGLDCGPGLSTRTKYHNAVAEYRATQTERKARRDAAGLFGLLAWAVQDQAVKFNVKGFNTVSTGRMLARRAAALHWNAVQDGQTYFRILHEGGPTPIGLRRGLSEFRAEQPRGYTAPLGPRKL